MSAGRRARYSTAVEGGAAGHRVLYRDSDGRIDELQHDGVRFTGFRGIGAKTWHDAMAAACLGRAM